MTYTIRAEFDKNTSLILPSGQQQTIPIALPDPNRLRANIMWRDENSGAGSQRRLNKGANAQFQVTARRRVVRTKSVFPSLGTHQQLLIHDGRGHILRTGFAAFPPGKEETVVLSDAAVDLPLRQIADQILEAGVDQSKLPRRLKSLSLDRVTLKVKSDGKIGVEVAATGKLKRRGQIRGRLLFDITLVSVVIGNKLPRGVDLVRVEISNLKVRGVLARIINGLSLTLLSKRLQDTMQQEFYSRVNGVLDDLLTAYQDNGGTAQSVMDMPLCFHRAEPGPDGALRLHFTMLFSVEGHIQNVSLDEFREAIAAI